MNIKVNCHKFQLSNGLTVLFCPQHQAPLFAANIIARVGSVNEGPGLTGVSHFLEHLMFKGTANLGPLDAEAEAPILAKIDALAAERLQEQAKQRTWYGQGNSARIEELTRQIAALEAEVKPYNVPNEMWGLYQRHGGVGLNAGTGCDGTHYYVTLPKNKLELWAYLEADRLNKPIFREFYSEREVVQEERCQRNDNDPDGMLREQVNALLDLGSPYEAPIVGWPRDLQTLTRAEVNDYFARYYAPANLVVAIVGDLELEEVREVVTHYFGAIPARPAPPWRFAERGVQRGERRITVEFEASPRLLIGYPGPQPGHPDQYALDVACEVLAAGRNSRFYRHLVESGLAFNAVIYQRSRAWNNDIMLALLPREPHSCAELEEAAQREIALLCEEGPQPRELERVRTRLQVDGVAGLQSPADLADSLAMAEAFRGGWEQFDDCQRFLEVSGEDVQRVLTEYLCPQRCTRGELIPKRVGST